MEVVIKERAQKSIRKITRYIFDKGYPETAIKFTKQLEEFAMTLGFFPEKYPICRQKSYNKRQYRCVPFNKNYIFIYKVQNHKVVVFNVVHAARIR
ncbi:MAG: type II toxin-antitoxin system RelE/ParE family toxin [Bacteroidia bacterium]|nr:type II toxin-antitoxin system RelE/ParE family toxin [Bacteroidia bacterium]